jgi:RNA polymerase sigma-70 factor (ECF subfamily)
MRIRSSKGVKNLSWEEILPKFEDGIWTETNPRWSKLPDEKLLEKESKRFIVESIEELPEDYRSAYLLKDVEQLSEEEVCEALNLTKAVMKMRVHRARLFLKKKIQEKFLKDEK